MNIIQAEADSVFCKKLKEECGIFGICNRDNLDVAQLTYYGLYALQHRGQESCGIVVNDFSNGVITRCHKDMGLVSECFDAETLSKLKGDLAIGHVRYSTTGDSCVQNAQPLVMKYMKGTLAVAYNGNLINADIIRTEQEKNGAIFQTTIDTEVIAYALAKERIYSNSMEEAVGKVLNYIKGACSIIVMGPRKIVVARNNLGIRPLCMGKIGNSTVFASESCALDAVNAKFVKDIEPGEIVVSDRNGDRFINPEPGRRAKICLFEYIYFARPDSIIEGVGVYEVRREMGRRLAKAYPVEADLVTGVPASGIAAAIGYSEVSGIPFGEGLIKNRYVGRTFINPDQKQREDGVMLKLNAIRQTVKGKRIILVDDSIVRGTTSARIVKILRAAGVTEIHMRISSPPIEHSCYYGIDTPSKEKLIAAKYSVEEIKEFIGVDSLGYLSLEDTYGAVSSAKTDFCAACFTGEYLMEHKINGKIKLQFEGDGKIETV
jgi:amidophosphoribosyltransferase